MSYLMPTYRPLEVEFIKGEGVFLWDKNGQRYLDAISGIAVCNLGHAHTAVAHAIAEQAKTLVHTSNLYHIEKQKTLAEKLCALANMETAFFCNSGTEANEAAIKLAKKFGVNKGFENPKIIVMEHAFHGRTMGALAATGNEAIRSGFGPMLDGFIRAPYDDINAIKQLGSQHSDIVAVFLEPVQGEGGVHILSDNYLNELRALCDANGWLLMCDEIQAGAGRTGRWFGHQHSNILPDVITLAKGLANGVPIGACLAQGDAAQTLTAGTHGTTFGGNPLACAAALAVIDTMTKNNVIDRVPHIAQYIVDGFKQHLSNVSGIKDIRNQGLMIGIELDRPCVELVAAALEKKQLLINVTQQSVIRLLPPLIIEKTHADSLVAGLSELIIEFLDN